MSTRDKDVPLDFRPDRDRRILELQARIAGEEAALKRRAGRNPPPRVRNGLDRLRGRKRPVVCMTMWDPSVRGYRRFESTLHAERETGVPHQLISRALDVPTMHAGRKTWRSLERLGGEMVEHGGKTFVRPSYLLDHYAAHPEVFTVGFQLAFGHVFSTWPVVDQPPAAIGRPMMPRCRGMQRVRPDLPGQMTLWATVE